MFEEYRAYLVELAADAMGAEAERLVDAAIDGTGTGFDGDTPGQMFQIFAFNIRNRGGGGIAPKTASEIAEQVAKSVARGESAWDVLDAPTIARIIQEAELPLVQNSDDQADYQQALAALAAGDRRGGAEIKPGFVEFLEYTPGFANAYLPDAPFQQFVARCNEVRDLGTPADALEPAWNLIEEIRELEGVGYALAANFLKDIRIAGPWFPKPDFHALQQQLRLSGHEVHLIGCLPGENGGNKQAEGAVKAWKAFGGLRGFHDCIFATAEQDNVTPEQVDRVMYLVGSGRLKEGWAPAVGNVEAKDLQARAVDLSRRGGAPVNRKNEALRRSGIDLEPCEDEVESPNDPVGSGEEAEEEVHAETVTTDPWGNGLSTSAYAINSVLIEASPDALTVEEIVQRAQERLGRQARNAVSTRSHLHSLSTKDLVESTDDRPKAYRPSTRGIDLWQKLLGG